MSENKKMYDNYNFINKTAKHVVGLDVTSSPAPLWSYSIWEENDFFFFWEYRPFYFRATLGVKGVRITIVKKFDFAFFMNSESISLSHPKKI